MRKLDKLLLYIAGHLSEPGTWQGVAFLLTLAGSRFANMPWGQCAALGARHIRRAQDHPARHQKRRPDIIIQTTNPEVQAALSQKEPS